MRVAVGATAALLMCSPVAGGDAGAQISESGVPGGCSTLGAGLRTTGGAALGAWVGFVVAKVKLSDWNADAHTPAAIRQRNQITLGGAVVGALAANLAFRHPCRVSRDKMYAGAPRVPNGRRDITAEEIQKSGITGSAYDLVYALRRQWLNVRVQSVTEAPRYTTDENGGEHLIQGEPQLVVYLDNMRMGTISQLRTLPISGIIGVRFYDPSQATFKWGAGHAQGAIQVLSVTEPTEGSLRPQPQKLAAPLSLPF